MKPKKRVRKKRDTDVKLPVGSLVMWGGSKNSVPAGWLACDGRLLQISKHQLLYDAIGHAFGNPPPSDKYDPKTHFFLPDFRGYFLRGVDEGTGRDPGVQYRYDIQNPGHKYGGVGSVQAEQVGAHNHEYINPIANENKNVRFYNGIHWEPLWRPTKDNKTNDNDPENRPLNAAIYFIIKEL